MANLSYIASTVLMGVALAAVVVAVLRLRDWHDYVPATAERSLSDRLRDVAGEPAVWTLTFLLLVAVFGGATVLYVSDVSVPGAGMLGLVLGVAAVVVVVGYSFVAAYSAARSRGLPTSQAVAEGTVLVGLLLVVVITVKLVV